MATGRALVALNQSTRDKSKSGSGWLLPLIPVRRVDTRDAAGRLIGIS